MRRLLQRAALYAFHILFARPVMHWVVGVRYRRRHLVPEGPCLVVSNHNSHLDAAVLLTMFPLRRLKDVHPVAAADYFGSNWFMKMMAMAMMNGIPIDRRPVPGQDPLRPIAERLAMGDSLIFFPEGSRGEAGVVAKFRPGVGVLVRMVPGLLVVPVFLSGPERIWPRGRVVPVPLSIDANIGKPRTYSAELDARDIAEQVRDDVLALAPPEPPAPGTRPAPPVRVAVCGVDPESRRRVFRRVTAAVGRLEPTFGVGEPMLESDASGVREASGPVARGPGRAWLALLAWVFRTGGRFTGRRFVEMVERAQVNQALESGESRFVVVDGSGLVDLLASADADLFQGPFNETHLNRLMHYLSGQRSIPFNRWWRFIRRAPEIWLINVFNLAQPPAPDILVALEEPVTEVMRRLRSRGEAQQPHQNESLLEKLQESYRTVGNLLQRRGRVRLMEFDLSAVSPDEIAGRVAIACAELSRERRAQAADSF